MIAALLTAALAWDPTPKEEALVRALSVRDGAPDCAEVEALVDEPAHSLARVVENVQLPPWAPMYAASCLIERHAAEKPEVLASWVVGTETKGLAKLVFRRLHHLEPDQARSLVDRGRSGPWQRELDAALVASPDAGLRALAR
ncbi:MAG: hypothetical protein H6737_18190 [Alphaproteobacteria bacterium]|nr:hypothetical protein [Alphaproteobacteria bacterium]